MISRQSKKKKQSQEIRNCLNRPVSVQKLKCMIPQLLSHFCLLKIAVIRKYKVFLVYTYHETVLSKVHWVANCKMGW